ncbi:hypothetical protein POTOM_032428 [Populus tomentosa]|uniref:Reverse transcriptase zinc-binding domain-containing protein n=1 Tax=Populus tomentosa TaxID=118781 RepID=A0A8X7ZBW7_POPTO|nr:hypothetical protein POTOM_032428 [Populus tomentosa]
MLACGAVWLSLVLASIVWLLHVSHGFCMVLSVMMMSIVLQVYWLDMSTSLASFPVSGTFLVNAHEFFRIKGESVQWTRVVWEEWSLPRTRFILWLAALGRLRTRDRLTKSWLRINRPMSTLSSAIRGLNGRSKELKLKMRRVPCLCMNSHYSLLLAACDLICMAVVCNSAWMAGLSASELNCIDGVPLRPCMEKLVVSVFSAASGCCGNCFSLSACGLFS